MMFDVCSLLGSFTADGGEKCRKSNFSEVSESNDCERKGKGDATWEGDDRVSQDTHVFGSACLSDNCDSQCKKKPINKNHILSCRYSHRIYCRLTYKQSIFEHYKKQEGQTERKPSATDFVKKRKQQ